MVGKQEEENELRTKIVRLLICTWPSDLRLMAGRRPTSEPHFGVHLLKLLVAERQIDVNGVRGSDSQKRPLSERTEDGR